MERKEKMLQALIRHNPPEQFKDLFVWYPPTRLSRLLGANAIRFRRCIDDPGKLRFIDMVLIAEIFGVDVMDINRLVFAQIAHNKRYARYKSVKTSLRLKTFIALPRGAKDAFPYQPAAWNK